MKVIDIDHQSPEMIKKRDSIINHLTDGRPFFAVSINKDGVHQHHSWNVHDKDALMGIELLRHRIIIDIYKEAED